MKNPTLTILFNKRYIEKIKCIDWDNRVPSLENVFIERIIMLY